MLTYDKETLEKILSTTYYGKKALLWTRDNQEFARGLRDDFHLQCTFITDENFNMSIYPSYTSKQMLDSDLDKFDVFVLDAGTSDKPNILQKMLSKLMKNPLVIIVTPYQVNKENEYIQHGSAACYHLSLVSREHFSKTQGNISIDNYLRYQALLHLYDKEPPTIASIWNEYFDPNREDFQYGAVYTVGYFRERK